MLVLPDRPAADETYDPARPVVEVVLAAYAAGGAVEVLRVVPSDGLRGWLDLTTPLPAVVPPGGRLALRFAVRPGLAAEADGWVEVVVAEGALTAVHTLRLTVWPDRPFTGSFGVDFGASRFAAAYIDPAAGPDPRPVVLAGGATAADTTFVADGTTSPPRAADPADALRRGTHSDRLVFRPRQALRDPRSRTLPGVGRVDDADGPVWALAGFLRRVGRAERPGVPARVTLATPTSLSPGQLGRFREAAACDPWLGPRLAPRPGRDLVLDEATAAAFTWVREAEAELAAAARGSVRLLVVDAGAGGVDVSLLELALHAPAAGRLRVTPRRLAGDGFVWGGGDRATATLFRLLKRSAATALAPADAPPADAPPDRLDGFAEQVIPTRFGGAAGAGGGVRFQNFLALWDAAETFKLGLARGPVAPVRLAGLRAADGTAAAVTVAPAAADVAAALAADADRALGRLAYVTTAEFGGPEPLDFLLLTGAAAALPAFRDGVVAPLVARHDRVAAEAGRPALRLVDWTDRGKAAVAAGAALAAYFHDHAPDAAEAAGDRLAVDLTRLRRDLPFSLLLQVAGAAVPRLLCRAGSPFPPAGAGLGPIAVDGVSAMPRMTFHRCAGRTVPPTAEAVRLTQYLGHADLPPGAGAEVRVEILPDHRVEVVTAAGERLPLVSVEAVTDALDEPFAGRL